jgi:Iron-sulfur cluster-binding domain
MEYSSPDAAPTEDSGEAAKFVSADGPALRALEGLVRDLRDGFDHPEIWPLLKEVVEANEHHEVLALALKLGPAQFEPRVGKIFELVAAIIHALAIDRAEGLAMLRRMTARDGSCPQIAGALFFVDRAGDPSKTSDLSTKFCDAPFRKFETLVDGSVAPCCSIWTQKRLGKLDNQNFEDIWNGTEAQEMRASILDGSFRHCHKQRCTYIMEDALPERDAIADPALREIIDEGKTALATKPNWLFLAHDWTCNLSRPSCRGELLGANEAQERRFEMIERQIFHPILNSSEEVLISASGQGDPGRASTIGRCCVTWPSTT